MLRKSFGMATALAVLALAVGLSLESKDALAGHPLGTNKTCTSGTVNCRYNWAGASTTFWIRFIDEYSDQMSGWSTAAQAAVSSWNVGPVRTSWANQPNATWTFLKDVATGETVPGTGYIMMSSNWGITKNCSTAGFCVITASAMNIYWSEAYVNRSVPELQYFHPYYNVFLAQAVFAHEIGHGLALSHHTQNDYYLMRPGAVPGSQSGAANGPSDYPVPSVPGDMGANPSCSLGTSTYAGIRCIYRWQ